MSAFSPALASSPCSHHNLRSSQQLHRPSGKRSSFSTPYRHGSGASFPEDAECGSANGWEEPGSRGTPFPTCRRRSNDSWDSQALASAASPTPILPPLRRPSLPPAAVPLVRTEGFRTQELAAEEPASRPIPAISRAKSQGLLSQQLSSSPAAPVACNTEAVKDKLEKCFGHPSYAGASPKATVPENLLHGLQEQHPVFKDEAVVEAFNVARWALEGQYRRNGDPLLMHGVETAKILANLGLDSQTVAAGLVHDVLDDSLLTEDELRSFLKPQICQMVVNVSKMSEVCQLHRNSLEEGRVASDNVSARLSTMLLAMADFRGVLVKLADRLHNMRTLEALPPHKQHRMAQETLLVFAPLANRLGVWSIKAELEDLCFQHLHPQEHRELAAKLAQTQQQRSLEASLDSLKAALEEHGIAYDDLSGRPKNLYGVHRKMQSKGYTADQIYDVRAMRVIVHTKADCYRVLRLVETLWQPVPGKFKDYVRRPKENGYQSLHTVVVGADGIPIELQIRTAFMHFVAEYGLAAHWRYKERLPDDSSFLLQQLVAWGKWLVAWKLELDDKKCRPSGSPGRDKSLLQLVGRLAGGAEGCGADGGCAFPEHAAHCRFVRYLRESRHAPEPVATALADSPVLVVVAGTAAGAQQLRVEELPPHCTAGQLQQSGLASLQGQDGLPAGDLQLLVNNKLASPDQLLRHGDKIELYEDVPAAGPSIVELHRQQLDRLWSRSGGLSGSVPAPQQPVLS